MHFRDPGVRLVLKNVRLQPQVWRIMASYRAMSGRRNNSKRVLGSILRNYKKKPGGIGLSKII